MDKTEQIGKTFVDGVELFNVCRYRPTHFGEVEIVDNNHLSQTVEAEPEYFTLTLDEMNDITERILDHRILEYLKDAWGWAHKEDWDSAGFTTEDVDYLIGCVRNYIREYAEIEMLEGITRDMDEIRD